MTISGCTGEKNRTIFLPNLGEKLFGQNSYFIRNDTPKYVFQKYCKYLFKIYFRYLELYQNTIELN